MIYTYFGARLSRSILVMRCNRPRGMRAYAFISASVSSPRRIAISGSIARATTISLPSPPSCATHDLRFRRGCFVRTRERFFRMREKTRERSEAHVLEPAWQFNTARCFNTAIQHGSPRPRRLLHTLIPNRVGKQR